MELTGIKFNYGQSTGTVNALSIRQNFTTGVAVPEWVKGKPLPKSSPAAYSITAVAGKIITIQANFAADPGAPAMVDVRADGGGVLGAIDPTTINISGGASVPEFVTLTLAHHQIGASGILKQAIQWDWVYKSTDRTWVAMGSSSHRVSLVLDSPSLPCLHPPTRPPSRT